MEGRSCFFGFGSWLIKFVIGARVDFEVGDSTVHARHARFGSQKPGRSLQTTSRKGCRMATHNFKLAVLTCLVILYTDLGLMRM